MSGMVEWESSRDLYKYIQSRTPLLSEIINQFQQTITVVEVGCGTSLPACSVLELLDDISYPGCVDVILQDYDHKTIEEVTKPAVSKFIDSLSQKFRSRINVSYIATSWESFPTDSHPAHIILSSECIYREDLFSPLTRVFTEFLHPKGVCLVSGKRYYFGCGGGTLEYSIYLESDHPDVSVDLIHTVEDGASNTREILAVFSRNR